MPTSRLEAFSDAVLAIIITIMVLELHVPEKGTWTALGDSATGFLTYALSFVYVGIYWNNHHHMFQLVRRVTGTVLWANLALLFFLSLLPFSTAWVDETGYESAPLAFYGINLLGAAVSYYLVQLAVVSVNRDSGLREALGSDWKGKLSPVAYLVGIALAYPAHFISLAVFVGIALVWLVPDRRLERYLEAHAVRE